MSDENPITAKTLSLLVDERIRGDVVFDVLIQKGIITEKELNKRYTEKLIEKREVYAAESLGMTVEEYNNTVK